MNELLKRINHLASISKVRELTSQEKEEQKQLRQQYIVKFREQFKKQLENTVFIDQNGNEILKKQKK